MCKNSYSNVKSRKTVLQICISLFLIGLLIFVIIMWPRFVSHIEEGMHSIWSFIEENLSDYTTESIQDYGNFDYANKEKFTKLFWAILPETIEPEYQIIQYRFCAHPIDAWGFEAYLEFTIDDPEKFAHFVQQKTQGLQKGTFHFDPSFQEYVLTDEGTGKIYDRIWLSDVIKDEGSGQWCYRIDAANIYKILINEAQQRVICVCISVSDGGSTGEEHVREYFRRFSINPAEYEEYTKRYKKK